MHVAAGREKGELELHGAFDVTARSAKQGSIAAIESELLAVQPDEVQDRARRLARGFAETAAELLQKECWALRRPEHEHSVDGGNVDTFVEQVDREDDADPSLGKVA